MKAQRPIAIVVAMAVGLTACSPEPVPAFAYAALGVVLLASALSRACGRQPENQIARREAATSIAIARVVRGGRRC